MYAAANARGLYLMCHLQMGFQDFLQKCEILEFDFDPKAIQQGRLHARDMQKFKVSSLQLWTLTSLVCLVIRVCTFAQAPFTVTSNLLCLFG